MRTVTIDKQEFLNVVRSNRDRHRSVFEEALVGYRARMTRELEQRLHDLQRARRVEHYIGLPEPQDHTTDYDRIITMAEMSVDDVVTLDAADFEMFVMDQWHWKQDFTDTTARYR